MGDLEVMVEGLEFVIFGLEVFGMGLYKFDSCVDKERFRKDIGVIMCVLGGMYGEEEVGDDRWRWVKGRWDRVGVWFEGVGKMDSVGMNDLWMIEGVYELVVIVMVSVVGG